MIEELFDFSNFRYSYFLYLQAELETVAKITHEKGKKNESQKTKYGTKTVAFVPKY